MQTHSEQSSSTASSTRQTRMGAGFVGLLLALPLAASAWYQTTSDDLPKLVSESPRPALLFSTHLYHHGEEPIEATSTLKTEFRFRNDGTEPVRIGKIERSCGCMKPMLSATTVHPGEIASLSVPISTVNEQPGEKEFLLTVHYTDPKPRQANLTIKAVFPERKVFVEPKALFLSQRTSSEIPFRVRVSDFRDEGLEVTSVLATAEFVDAILTPTTGAVLAPTPDPVFGTPDIQQTNASMTAESQTRAVRNAGGSETQEAIEGTSALIDGKVEGNVPPGRHHILIAAKTSDPEYPTITVPMLITGPAYPEGQDVQMTASAVQLVASNAPQARRRGHVAFSAPAEWKFAEPKVWPEELEARLQTNPSPVAGRTSTIVEIELTDLPSDHLKDGVVSVRTKDGKNLITVKVNFLWP